MEAVLDFSRPLDVGLLDKVVVCMNTPSDRQVSTVWRNVEHATCEG